MKFCINCQHFREGRFSEHLPMPMTPSQCLRLGHIIEPVRGRQVPVKVLLPRAERASPSCCGPEAIYYEAN